MEIMNNRKEYKDRNNNYNEIVMIDDVD